MPTYAPADVDLQLRSYAAYFVVTVAMTVWVARTLFRSGRVFLVDAVAGNEPLADSINRLLVVGFYLVNLGFVLLNLAERHAVRDGREAVEALSVKVGVVLLVLGGMHFFNLLLLTKARRRTAPCGSSGAAR